MFKGQMDAECEKWAARLMLFAALIFAIVLSN
jgi:hypothetical protein